MLETDFQTKFGQWFLQNKTLPVFKKHSQGFELKVAKGKTFSLKSWKDKQSHQLRALANASTRQGIYYKLSDMSADQKPFDCFFLSNADAFLVPYFERSKVFYLIRYEDIPDSNSLTQEQCLSVSEAYKLPQKQKKETIDF